MAIVSALKAQLKCDMYQEAQLTADKADELIAYMKVSQPGVFSYYNWRMKLVHAQLVLNFGAFVKPGAFEFTETSKQAQSTGEKMLAFFQSDIPVHVWDSIICPTIFSLIK